VIVVSPDKTRERTSFTVAEVVRPIAREELNQSVRDAAILALDKITRWDDA
jgi:hypothetical protein